MAASHAFAKEEIAAFEPPIRTSGGASDAAILLKNGSVVQVGGSGKENDIEAFKAQLPTSWEYAAPRGGQAYFVYAEGTPYHVVAEAERILGIRNVFQIGQRPWGLPPWGSQQPGSD